MSSKLTIGVSTVQRNCSKALAIFSGLGHIEGVSYLVVSQCEEERSETVEETECGATVLLVKCTDKGLSKSRNEVLRRSGGGYVWFLDDDVSISRDAVIRIMGSIHSDGAEVLLGQIACSDAAGFYKSYKKTRAGWKGALRSSSIEVIVNADFLSDNGISFDERLGLGSEYPSGEENKLLLDVVKAKGRLGELQYPVVSHPCNIAARSPKLLLADHRILIAKGIVSASAGRMGLFVMLYFSFKAAIISRSFKPFYYVPAGYVKEKLA